jgi:hypothetical protein
MHGNDVAEMIGTSAVAAFAHHRVDAAGGQRWKALQCLADERHVRVGFGGSRSALRRRHARATEHPLHRSDNAAALSKLTLPTRAGVCAHVDFPQRQTLRFCQSHEVPEDAVPMMLAFRSDNAAALPKPSRAARRLDPDRLLSAATTLRLCQSDTTGNREQHLRHVKPSRESGGSIFPSKRASPS